MLQTSTEKDRLRPRRITYVPPVLEQWAVQNGFAKHRWIQVFPTEDLTDKTAYSLFGQMLYYVAGSEGYRYFVGESTKVVASFPTCYWLVVPS